MKKKEVSKLIIKEGYFIQPIETDRADEYLALSVEVENNAASEMTLLEESFYLVEKGEDEKFTALRLAVENQIKEWNDTLLPANSGVGTIVFQVDSSKQYTLFFDSKAYDEDEKLLATLETALTPADYADTKAVYNEPKEALQAYIDVVLLQKENLNYETLLANDAKAEIAKIKKAYIGNLSELLSAVDLSEEETTKAFESYVAKQREVVEVTLAPLAYTGQIGQVQVDYVGISKNSIFDLFYKYRDEHLAKLEAYDGPKADAYAFSKLEEIYAESAVGKSRETLKVMLTKAEDKWHVDLYNENNYENNYLLQAFLGDVK